MRIIYTGQNVDDSSFLTNALISGDGIFEPDLVSASPTQLVLRNPENGWVTTVTGTGFSLDANGEPNGGTITGFSIVNGSQTIAVVDLINWSLPGFVSAVDQAAENDNPVPLATLFNQSGGITVDASGAGAGYDMDEFNDVSDFINVAMTITGSNYDDDLFGGNGNDTINAGSNPDSGDNMYATFGNDTYDFAGAGDESYYFLSYGRSLFNGLNLNWDGAAGTATVAVEGFTDTLLNTDEAFWGLGIDGTGGADTFTVTSADNLFMQLFGGRGMDTFNLNSAGGVIRIEYNYGAREDATQGAIVNLGTGFVANDGFGTTDTMNITYGDGRIELRGTNFADVLIGGDGRDSFITRQGNDTIDGGDGWDRIRYDRNGVENLNVDLAAGTATGSWYGQAFTHTISNIEYVRGTREGNDTIAGSDAYELFQGRGGDDLLSGGGGGDTLDGGTGNDTLNGDAGNDELIGDAGFDSLNGGAGDDTLDGGANTDRLNGGDGNDRLIGDQGFDNLYGDAGNDTLLGGTEADRLYGGTGDDVLRAGTNVGLTVDGLFGEDGNDSLYGEGGFDFLDGGSGNDLLDGGAQADNLYGRTGDDTLLGGDGLDRLFGGSDDDEASGGAGNDGLFGEQGNDTLNGDAGNDRFYGGTGNDLIDGGADNDTINGGAGFDTISGGTGDDLVFGRFNADTFVFEDGHGNDTVADFNALNNFERIDLSGISAITSLADLDLGSNTNGAATQVGANVLIDTGGGNMITLNSVNLADLDSNDFIF
ncbi:MAG: calcium-binding protein [Sulfitobacter sp.]